MNDRDFDFERGRAFGFAPSEDTNVHVVKEKFDQPTLDNPTDLRASIINKAATEAREAYDHWIEAVSFLRIVEPGAEKEYGSLTKGLLDATTYMEGKE